jgi:hypothetical protein
MRISEIKTREDLFSLAIAQDDDCDYEESGYIVVADDKKAAIAQYSHCSCYGTWTAMTKDSKIIWEWIGPIKDLIQMAKKKIDPHSPWERIASQQDSDYDHLMNCYDQVLKWNKDRRKKKV